MTYKLRGNRIQKISTFDPKTTLNRILRSRSFDVRMVTVSVTGRGQTMIPAEFRKKYGIEEGTTLEIEDTGEGLLLKKMVSTIDMVGTGKASQHDIFSRLDKMRAENER